MSWFSKIIEDVVEEVEDFTDRNTDDIPNTEIDNFQDVMSLHVVSTLVTTGYDIVGAFMLKTMQDTSEEWNKVRESNPIIGDTSRVLGKVTGVIVGTLVKAAAVFDSKAFKVLLVVAVIAACIIFPAAIPFMAALLTGGSLAFTVGAAIVIASVLLVCALASYITIFTAYTIYKVARYTASVFGGVDAFDEGFNKSYKAETGLDDPPDGSFDSFNRDKDALKDDMDEKFDKWVDETVKNVVKFVKKVIKDVGKGLGLPDKLPKINWMYVFLGIGALVVVS